MRDRSQNIRKYAVLMGLTVISSVFFYKYSAPDGAMGSAKSFRLIASPADTTLARHCSRRAANGLSLLVVARRAPSHPDPLALS